VGLGFGSKAKHTNIQAPHANIQYPDAVAQLALYPVQ